MNQLTEYKGIASKIKGLYMLLQQKSYITTTLLLHHPHSVLMAYFLVTLWYGIDIGIV